MVKKTLIVSAVVILVGWILKDTFYKALCEQGSFGYVMGWIAFKSPSLIIALLIGVSIYLYVTEKN